MRSAVYRLNVFVTGCSLRLVEKAMTLPTRVGLMATKHLEMPCFCHHVFYFFTDLHIWNYYTYIYIFTYIYIYMFSFKCTVIYIIYISYMCDHVCMFSFLRLKENMFVNFKKLTSIWTGSSKSWSGPPPPHLAGSIHLKSKPPSPAVSQTFFSGKDENQHESFTVYLGSLVSACSC